MPKFLPLFVKGLLLAVIIYALLVIVASIIPFTSPVYQQIARYTTLHPKQLWACNVPTSTTPASASLKIKLTSATKMTATTPSRIQSAVSSSSSELAQSKTTVVAPKAQAPTSTATAMPNPSSQQSNVSGQNISTVVQTQQLNSSITTTQFKNQNISITSKSIEKTLTQLNATTPEITPIITTKPTVTPTFPNFPCQAAKTAFKVNLNYSDVDYLEKNIDFIQKLDRGGSWRPAQSHNNINVSIIVPYRRREQHLAVFILNMHQFMQMQNISYIIIVVHQVDDKKFNRAGLFNAGYKEAIKMNIFNDCYFFHDVDLIPENGNLTYCCSPNAVLHYSTAIWRSSSPNDVRDYSRFFGGVIGATASQFKKANGFSNRFWGWGGEDDEFARRIRLSGQKTTNIPFSQGRYVMFTHEPDKGNEKNGQRLKILRESGKTWATDGLNSLNYTVKGVLLTKYANKVLEKSNAVIKF